MAVVEALVHSQRNDPPPAALPYLEGLVPSLHLEPYLPISTSMLLQPLLLEGV